MVRRFNKATRLSLQATALFVMGAVITANCSRDAALAPLDKERVSAGTWGGDSAGMIVTDQQAHLHIGCTLGDILGVITLDADGNFARDGTYQPRAFPVALGPSVPARFTGSLSDRTMRVSVVVNDTIDRVTRYFGPVVIELGVAPRLGPCPICLTLRAP